MSKILELAREISDYTICGEGNVSVRVDENSFLIKASGTSLHTLSEEDLTLCNTNGAQIELSHISNLRWQTEGKGFRSGVREQVPSRDGRRGRGVVAQYSVSLKKSGGEQVDRRPPHGLPPRSGGFARASSVRPAQGRSIGLA